MFKRILVTHDGSKAAQHALNKAIVLARNQKAKLRIVHVLDIAGFTGGIKFFESRELIDKMQKYAENLLRKSKAFAEKKGIKTDIQLIQYNDYKTSISYKILKEAKRWHADVIVIGSHGHRGFKKIILGSVIEEVLRSSMIPIFVFH